MLKRLFLSVALVCCLISLGQARDEKTVEDCEKNIPESLKGRVCQLRNYTTVDNKDMAKHMQCVLEVVGFVESDGKVKKEDLLELLKKIDSNIDHDSNVDNCVSEASSKDGEQKANAFYMCLLKTGSSSAFKNAVDYKELLKAGKMEMGDSFDKNKVEELMKDIDDGVCKKNQ